MHSPPRAPLFSAAVLMTAGLLGLVAVAAHNHQEPTESVTVEIDSALFTEKYYGIRLEASATVLPPSALPDGCPLLRLDRDQIQQAVSRSLPYLEQFGIHQGGDPSLDALVARSFKQAARSHGLLQHDTQLKSNEAMAIHVLASHRLVSRNRKLEDESAIGTALRQRRRWTAQLLTAQQKDGGWARTLGQSSDAHATGEAIFALVETGIASEHPVIRAGVDYLLHTQRNDGSWSRPCSAGSHFRGSSWATIGLSRVLAAPSSEAYASSIWKANRPL